MTYPEALPHDPIKQIGEDLFVVHGSVRLFPVVSITRNMAIVRNNNQLTLINAVRMTDAELTSLEALGDIAHVLRLGPLHGRDDGFYVDRYQAEFWSFGGGTTYTTPAAAQPLTDGGALPFPNAELIAFEHLTQPEGVILLKNAPGVLLTCDSIQSYSTPPHMPHTAWLTQRLLPLAGFPKETIIGPIWLKKMATNQQGIKSELERLLSLEFDQLLSAHGTFVAKSAFAEVEQALTKAFA